MGDSGQYPATEPSRHHADQMRDAGTNHFPRRRIKFEAELDRSFCQEMMERVGDDSIKRCIQCGTCTSTCPVSLYMDYTPRRLVAMIREGFKDEVIKSFTPWICASCYSCTVECPKDVKITELMYNIKQKALEEHIYPKRLPTPILAKEFFNSVMKFGRTNESWLMTNFLLKSNPFQLLKNGKLGMRLYFSGRMELKHERIKNQKQLLLLLHAVDDSPTPSPESA